MATETPKYHGKIVALEGPLDAVSTQLRLLPTVPHMMILPDFHNYLPTDKTHGPFNARQLVAEVQKAVKARHDVALNFLEQATADKKRMVFMCGGTVGAQAFCLSAISQNETNGDLGKAETIFRGIAKGGVQGLSSRPSSKGWNRRARRAHNKKPNKRDEELVTESDATILAMRAADALDRDTEGLQPPSQDVNVVFGRQTRVYSLPLFDFSDQGKILDAIRVLGTSMGDNPNSIYLQLEDGPNEKHRSRSERVGISSIVCRRPMRITVSVPLQPPSSAEEVNEHPPPLPDMYSPPLSPAVVYGEATVVEVRSSSNSILKRRAQSLDSMLLVSNNLVTESGLWDVRSGHDDAKGDAHRHRKRPSSLNEAPPTDEAPDYQACPKAVFVKAKPTTISRSNTIPARARQRAGATKFNESDGSGETVLELVAVPPPSWESVLQLVEDHTIYLAEATRDHSFNLVLTGFKGGHYPVPEKGDEKYPTHQEEDTAPIMCPYRKAAMEAKALSNADDYDPYASHGEYGPSVAQWIQRGSVERLRDVTRLPNAALLAPPPVGGWPAAVESEDARFQVLSTSGQTTAVDIHRSLRSLLGLYAPPKDTAYHQEQLLRFPGIDCLWTPFFREQGAGSKGKRGNRIDLILAIGAQHEVQETFVATIVGQLEKLGTKPSGLSRSRRLHLSFLLFGVMQAFARQPLPTGTQDDPMQNHTLMATLLVSHLDAYFNTDANVRFLILEYSDEQLDTVLALRTLFGSDLFKVAGILDGDDPGTRVPSPRPSSHAMGRSGSDRAPSPVESSDETAVMSLPSPSPSSEMSSFSKANFILTSSASDSEIANLISTVWKVLISTSDFYVPEHTPRKVLANEDLTRRSPSRATQHPRRQNSTQANASNISTVRVVGSAQSNKPFMAPPRLPSVLSLEPEDDDIVNTIAKAGMTTNGLATNEKYPFRNRPLPAEPIQETRPPSPTPSARSVRSAWTARSGRLMRQMRRRDAEKDQGSDVDEDDMFYVDERRLMPEYHRRLGQKANTRKALKWLGLV